MLVKKYLMNSMVFSISIKGVKKIFLLNFLAVFVFIVSIFLFSKAAGSIALNKINTVSFIFYRDIIPVVFIGSLLIFNNLVDNHYVVALLSDETKFKGLLFVLYSLITIPLGMIFLNYLSKINVKTSFDSYRKNEIFQELNFITTKTLAIFLSVISLGTLIYILISSPYVPILSALKGDTELASIQRRAVKADFSGIIYIRNIMGLYFIPIVTYYMYVQKVALKSLFFNVLFYFNLIITTILLTYDTQKAQIIYFLIGFLILDTFIKGKIPRIKLIMIGIFSLVGVLVMYIITTDALLNHLLRFDSVIMYRLFIGQISGYYLSLEWFPNLITDSTYLVGIPSFILKLFGVENVESARLLMMYLNPQGVEAGSAGLVSSYFLGEAWANYGYWGLIMGPFIVGIVLQSVHIWLLKSQKNAFNLSLYTIITTKWVITGGFTSFLYLKVLIIPILLYVFYKLLINFIINLK